MKIWLGSILLAVMALGACAQSKALDKTGAAPGAAEDQAVYIIRHLQKAEGSDPPLTAEGTAAAEQLAAMLADKGIAAIYATATRRAMDTAAPLSRATGIAVVQYDARDPAALVAEVAAVEGSVLVVGHSNTVPDLVTRFGGHPAPVMTEKDYGTVYAVGASGTLRALAVE